MAFKCPKSSDNEALLFSQRQPPQARMNDSAIARPARHEEHLAIVRRLATSRVSHGAAYDPARVHVVNVRASGARIGLGLSALRAMISSRDRRRYRRRRRG
jgi:hypothetical protein